MLESGRGLQILGKYFDQVVAFLEHVTVRGVRRMWPELGQKTLVVPVLPKLKVFGVYVSQEKVFFELVVNWVFEKYSRT